VKIQFLVLESFPGYSDGLRNYYRDSSDDDTYTDFVHSLCIGSFTEKNVFLLVFDLVFLQNTFSTKVCTLFSQISSSDMCGVSKDHIINSRIIR